MAPHRATTRLRYGRLAATGCALTVTLVAVLGGAGLLPGTGSPRSVEQTVEQIASLDAAAAAAPRRDVDPAAGADPAARSRVVTDDDQRFTRADVTRAARARQSLEVPARSGEGRRIVFDMGAQRVWLVESSGAVRRTYLVSGSLSDNLDAGTHEVYSKSERAWGIDDSGSMRYMVRFAHGDRAAIGFHDIPVKDGRQVQTRADLGAPQSHGCIRQARPDALALWDFAPVGTPVVVVA